MEKKTLYSLGLAIYLLFVFLSEIAYRNGFYNASVEYIKEIEQGGFLEYFYVFWGLIVFYGIIGAGIFITLVFYPLNIFIVYLLYEVILIFLMCLLKSLYASPRPYWDILLERKNEGKPLFEPTSCEPEYGNPSGHALQATYALCLWHLFIHSKFFKKITGFKQLLVKYSTLAFCIISMILLMYSRVHRQVHSFNQIIFGFLISLGMYFAFCHILELNQMKLHDFLSSLDKYKIITNAIFLILFILSVIFGFSIHNENEEEYTSILTREDVCNFNKDRIYGKNTAYHSTIIFLVIGAYIGILYTRYKIKKNFPRHEKVFYKWNTKGFMILIKMSIISFIIPGTFSALGIFIPYTMYPLKFILGIIFYFIYGFGAFGFCYYYGCVYLMIDFLKKEPGLLGNDDDDDFGNITENIIQEEEIKKNDENKSEEIIKSDEVKNDENKNEGIKVEDLQEKEKKEEIKNDEEE